MDEVVSEHLPADVVPELATEARVSVVRLVFVGYSVEAYLTGSPDAPAAHLVDHPSDDRFAQ